MESEDKFMWEMSVCSAQGLYMAMNLHLTRTSRASSIRFDGEIIVQQDQERGAQKIRIHKKNVQISKLISLKFRFFLRTDHVLSRKLLIN